VFKKISILITALTLSMVISGCSTTQDYYCESRYKGSQSDLLTERSISITLTNGDTIIPMSNVKDFRFTTKSPDRSCNGSFIADARKVTSIDEKIHSSRIELRNGKSFMVDSANGRLPLSDIHSETHFYNQTKDELYTGFFSPNDNPFAFIVVNDDPIPETILERFAVYLESWKVKKRDRDLEIKLINEKLDAEREEAYRLIKERQKQEEYLAQEKIRKNEDLMLSPAGLGGLICKNTPLQYEIYYENQTPFGTSRTMAPKVANKGQIAATIEQVNRESRRIQYKVRSYDADIPRIDLNWISKGLSYQGVFLQNGMLNWDSLKGWSPCHYVDYN
jgi:hypothetical protein